MHTVTAAEVWSQAPHCELRNYYVEAAEGRVWLSVLAKVDGHVYVRGLKEDSPIGLLTRTGQRIDRHGHVRVRVDFARDTGDAAGTLRFDNRADTSVGGVADHRLFESQED